jgi:MinD-like ATPase involved in chromosome partitioning or flagellar assembly
MGVEEILQKPFKMGDFMNAVGRHFEMGWSEKKQDEKVESKIEKKVERKIEKKIEKKIYNEIEATIEELNYDKNTKNTSTRKGVFAFIATSSSGKTSLVVNLANILRNLEKDKPSVCILDLNLALPAAYYMFDKEDLTKAKRDIYDITQDLNYLNEELVMDAIIINKKNGIHLVNTPTSPETVHKIKTIRAAQIEKLIVTLREMYDIVLIDTPNNPTDDTVWTPIQFADKNFLLLEPNFINIVNASRIFYIMEKLEESTNEDIKDKTFLILNRNKKSLSLNDDTTKRFLEGKKIIIRIPEDDNYMKLINEGKLISNSNSIMLPPIKKLAKFLFDHDEEETEKKKGSSLFTSIKNRYKK